MDREGIHLNTTGFLSSVRGALHSVATNEHEVNRTANPTDTNSFNIVSS
jgi:hypothetical protein